MALPVSLGLVTGCDRDDDLAADGCREMRVELDIPESEPEETSGFLYTARLRDGCLELVHNCCACEEVNAVATRSPLAVFPPVYSVRVDVREDPEIDCAWAGRDSTRFTLAGIRANDPAFDRLFEGLDGEQIEVR